MKNDNYVVIQGWMINQLKLTGNELMVYAIIYGFSQDGDSKFHGSIQYMANSIGISRQSVHTLIQRLEEKNYIRKIKTRKKENTRCNYEINMDILGCKETLHLGVKKLDTGVKKLDKKCKETLHNNIIYINNNKINNNTSQIATTDGSEEPPLSESQKAALELSNLLLVSHRKEFPDYLAGKDPVPKWAKDIEKLIRIDQKASEKIKQVILWVKKPDNFWFHNIESGAKLRKQFERLYGQMITEKKQRSPPKNLEHKESLTGLKSLFGG